MPKWVTPELVVDVVVAVIAVVITHKTGRRRLRS
jgi:hypothetical protein